jgi:hypothetical protein
MRFVTYEVMDLSSSKGESTMKNVNTQPSAATVTKYENGKPVSTTVVAPTSKGNKMTDEKVAKPKVEKVVKDPKTPRESKLSRDCTFTVLRKKNDGEDFKHNQRDVIYETIAAKAVDGKVNLATVVTAITESKELTARMNTVQPVERCVRYHAKFLKDVGILNVTFAEKPKAEKPAKPEKAAKPAAPVPAAV